MTRPNSLTTLGSLALLCWMVCPPVVSAATNASPLHERLKKATVRIEVAEAGVREVGSGTIVQRVGTQALVVTCAHVFEATRGQIPFRVTVFENGQERSLPGKLLTHDFRLDVALVAVEGVGDVQPIPVPPAGHAYSIGEPLLVAGCDLGGTPGTWDTHLTAVSRFSGRPNVEVAEIPRDGRSGGGLVTASGTFVGVCNGINPIEKEGIYAAIEAVQQQLAKAGLPAPSQQAPPQSLANQSLANQAMASSPAQTPAPIDDQMPVVTRPRRTPEPAPVGSSARVRPIAEAPSESGDVEVICIVRSSGDADASSKVIVLKDASPEFLRAMAAERRRAEQ